MARFHPDASEPPLADQLKALTTEELMDFWEEHQFLEEFLAQELADPEGPEGPEWFDQPEADLSAPDYELLILRELSLRASQQLLRLKPMPA